jgi:uncharacterized protein (DUF2141 family)
MKTLLGILIFLILLPAQKSGYDLTIRVDGFAQLQGKLEIGIFNKEEGFLDVGAQYRLVRLDVTAKVITYTFKDLPAGDYAVSLYHDVNNDRECNRNFFGIPTESYGFSNNFRPVMSKPDFDDARFHLDTDTTIIIHLN